MTTTTDTRPSIAEMIALRGALANGEYAATMRLIDAAPVLLEIAAAALAWRAKMERTLAHLWDHEDQALFAALDKVTE